MLKLTEIKVTPRDLEILQLLADGRTNGEIAGLLGIGERTVKGHLRTMFIRLGLTDSRAKGKRILLAAAMVELRAAMPILQAA